MTIQYQVRVLDPHAHLFQVTLTITKPAAAQGLSLPVWIPGSYLVREFARNLQNLQARQGKKLVALTQLDKCSWHVSCVAGKPLVLTYEIYAFDHSVRAAWLDTRRGFFNGTSMFLKVHGQEASPHQLELVSDKLLRGWKVATSLTALKVKKSGFGIYSATHYDELIDSPVEMGDFWSGTFTACGVPHQFVVSGAPPGFDGTRLMTDTQAICETQIRFWHGSPGQADLKDAPPHKRYVFMLNAVDEGYGGLEHRNSTALICQRRDLPRDVNRVLSPKGKDARAAAAPTEGYIRLLGLISHEYFHTWNVKRLRPIEFTGYDHGQENYTELLWFFEGFTSYYDDLLLLRAGLIEAPIYLKLLTKTLNQVLQTPGRALQSVAQASFDAWTKYYRPDENTPNATVSYYTKGAVVALCLDLTLRKEGQTTLDHVMRALWLRCQGGPMREEDLGAVLNELSGRSYAAEIRDWVHGCADLPAENLLTRHGVAVLNEPAALAQRLGLRVVESAGIQVKTVLRGGSAERAGFAAGDEWLALEVGSGKSASAWRLTRLDDVLLYCGSVTKMVALLARDKRLVRATLTLPNAVSTWQLVLRDRTRADVWLANPARPPRSFSPHP